MQQDIPYTITKNRRLSGDVYHLELKSAERLQNPAKPGMFAMLKIGPGARPLLRRPLSYLSCGHRKVSFLYRVIGEGTKILSQSGNGSEIKVLGPLGNGFEVSPTYKRIALVAGGMGLPPILFMANELSGIKDVKVDFIYGAANNHDLFFAHKIEETGVKLRISTEDGSIGKKGLVTDVLSSIIEGKSKPDAVFACGPHGMLQAVHNIAINNDIPCNISLEARMACGTGVCLGCAIKATGDRYLKVCDDGPVFDSATIFGER